ncbi:MFS transporter [Exilibacterium tricleocarpae]|uniref:MFS transporter n=1 Tax=Exilibacterium tricleocarpae TaxID=2591008 RepID=A0A545T6A7_9GAMM|nr:MFS transporter [Exilibacterium tricleocarpae]TQV72718.1 MFS transporter [Exilibacterium tricleocarpae]
MKSDSQSSSSSDIEKLIDNADFSPMQLVVLVLCCGLNILDGIDVLAMSYTASSVAEEWGLQPHQLGAVFSSALIGMMLGAMFIAPLADKYGRRPIVLGSVALISVGMLVTGFVTSVWQLVILRGITGLGIGAMLASLTALVSEFMPHRRRNFCLGILQASYPLGAVIGSFFAVGMIPEYGWRSVFIAAGLMGFVALAVCLVLLPESMQILAKNRNGDGLVRINRLLAKMKVAPIAKLAEAGGDKSGKSDIGVGSLLASEQRRMTINLWMAFMLSFSTLYFLISWIPKLLSDAGLPLDKSIYTGAALNLGGALGIVALGFISTYWKITKLIMVFLLGGAGFMVLFASLNLSMPFLLTLTALIGFSVFGGFVSLYSVAARIYPPQARTTGVGWAIGMGRMGAIIGPYAAGVMIGMGFTTSTNFLVFAVPLVAAAFFTINIKSPKLLSQPVPNR